MHKSASAQFPCPRRSASGIIPNIAVGVGLLLKVMNKIIFLIMANELPGRGLKSREHLACKIKLRLKNHRVEAG